MYTIKCCLEAKPLKIRKDKVDKAFKHGNFGILILKICEEIRELQLFKNPR